MSMYLLVKWRHIVSATIMFGTGIGVAFSLLVVYWRMVAKPAV